MPPGHGPLWLRFTAHLRRPRPEESPGQADREDRHQQPWASPSLHARQRGHVPDRLAGGRRRPPAPREHPRRATPPASTAVSASASARRSSPSSPPRTCAPGSTSSAPPANAVPEASTPPAQPRCCAAGTCCSKLLLPLTLTYIQPSSPPWSTPSAKKRSPATSPATSAPAHPAPDASNPSRPTKARQLLTSAQNHRLHALFELAVPPDSARANSSACTGTHHPLRPRITKFGEGTRCSHVSPPLRGWWVPRA